MGLPEWARGPDRQKIFVLWSEGVLWRQNYVDVEADVQERRLLEVVQQHLWEVGIDC